MDHRFWWTVEIPGELVRDRSLSPVSRYIYKLLAHKIQSGEADFGDNRATLPQRELAAAAQIKDIRTLRSHLYALDRSGWIRMIRRPGPLPAQYELNTRPRASRGRFLSRMVSIPAALIDSRMVAPQAVSMYATIVMLARSGPGVAIHQRHLARLVGFGNITTLRKYTRQLVREGWLRLSRGAWNRAYQYEPLDPHFLQRKSVLFQVQQRLEEAAYYGEALLKEMLTVLVPDDHYQDNARPGFLVNPGTDQLLEFDRWYTRARVAFEFNGPQHYRTTQEFPGPEVVRKQRLRDLLKIGISSQLGIHLLTIEPRDLTFPRLIEIIDGVLPVRRLSWQDPVVRFLDEASQAYVSRVRQRA